MVIQKGGIIFTNISKSSSGDIIMNRIEFGTWLYSVYSTMPTILTYTYMYYSESMHKKI